MTAPRKTSEPLLLKLSERVPENVDYLSVSYGLTLPLLRFWSRAGYIPLYIRSILLLSLSFLLYSPLPTLLPDTTGTISTPFPPPIHHSLFCSYWNLFQIRLVETSGSHLVWCMHGQRCVMSTAVKEIAHTFASPYIFSISFPRFQSCFFIVHICKMTRHV